MDQDDSLTIDEIHELLEKFWVMLIHAVLYSSGIYGPNYFRKVRLPLEVVGFQCTHPDVCSWAETSAKAISTALKSTKIHRVSFVKAGVGEGAPTSYEPSGRLTVDTEFLPRLKQSMAIVSRNTVTIQLMAALNAVYARLPGLFKTAFDSDQPDSTIVILAESADGSQMNLENLDWVVSEPQLHKAKSSESVTPEIVPVRFVDAKEFTFSLYYQS